MAGQTTMGAAPTMLASAARRHQAGDLDGAESLYREVLEVSPGHTEALHRWGLIAYQRGTHEHAIERIDDAYRQYRCLMRHWRDTLGVPMFEVVYQDRVADQEGISRALLDYCGLEWDEACLFHENPHRVSTWSFVQVRRPLYAGSVGRSRPYRAHLGPLIAALEHGAG